MNTNNSVRITYRLEFKDDRHEVFELKLNPSSLEPLERITDDLPHWTRLDFNQCPNCPLKPDSRDHCPLSARLAPLVERIGDITSVEPVMLKVITPERTVSQQTAAQEAVSSLIGLVSATSGCPITSFFKPMARFHLPLASLEETLYRALSMYQLGQYFRHRRGLDVDMQLDGLRNHYENINTVNAHLVKRIRAARKQDAAINAMVLLDTLSKMLPDMQDEMMQIEGLFQSIKQGVKKRQADA